MKKPTYIKTITAGKSFSQLKSYQLSISAKFMCDKPQTIFSKISCTADSPSVWMMKNYVMPF